MKNFFYLILMICGLVSGFEAQAQQVFLTGTDTVACFHSDTIFGCQNEVLVTINSGTGEIKDANGDFIYTLASNGNLTDLNNDLIGTIDISGNVKDSNQDLIGTVSGGEVRDLNNDLLGTSGTTPAGYAAFYYFFFRMEGGL